MTPKQKILVTLLVVGFVVFGGKKVYDSTRGLRNNNPGNIRKTGDNWQGLSDNQTDVSFFQFTHAKWGIRAMAKLLKNYQTRYGLNTVNDIINRWAPPVENNTSSYVSHVAELLEVSPYQSINLNDTDVLTKLVEGVIKHENGFNPYSIEAIAEGVALI